MTELDNLYIKIQAEAVKANDAIDRLDDKLERLERALTNLNKVNINGFANGVERLSKAMVSMNQVKTADFTRLAKNLANLSTVNVAGLNSSASAVIMLSKAFTQLSNATANANNIAIFANALSKLGNKGVQNAIVNIPQLANAMKILFQTLATAPTVNQNIIDMTNALANLASQGNKVGSASKTIVSGLNRTNTAMARTTKQATSLASAFGKFYASYFLIIRGVKGLWDAVESSMDYVETYNYFNVALGEIGKDTAARFGEFGKESAEKYAKEFGDRLNELNKKMTGYIVGDEGELILAGDMGLGLNIEQMMNFQAKVLSVTNSVGLMGEASTSTAKALTMLAGDYSSLTNLPVEQVMEKLTSGMIGQSRALYSLGLDITNNTLQQYAYAEGIEKAVSEMTQSEKMQLRLLAILDQSEVAWGDLGRTVDSVANQYRVFQQQIKNLGRTFGSLFLPIVQNVLPYVNGLVISLNNLFTSLGFSMYGETWLSDLQDGISGSVQGDVGELEDGLEDANDAANKLKKSLSSFDELEVISISGVASAADAEGVIDLTASIADALGEYEAKWNEAFDNAELRASQFASVITDKLTPVKEVFANVFAGEFDLAGENLSELVSNVAKSLSNAIDEIDWEEIGNKIGELLHGIDWELMGQSVAELIFSAINAGIKLWKGSFETAPIETSLITALGLMKFKGISFANLIPSLVKSLTSALSSGITVKDLAIAFGSISFTSPVAMELGNKILSDLESWIDENFGKEFTDAIGRALTGLVSGGFGFVVAGPIGGIVGLIIGNIINYLYDPEYYNQIGAGIAESINKGLESISSVMNFDTSNQYLEKAASSLASIKDAETFQEIGKAIVDNILSGMLYLSTVSNEPFVDLGNWIRESIFKTFGIQSEGGIATKFKSVGEGIVNGIGEGISSAFEGLEQIFKELWNGLADWVNEKLTLKIPGFELFDKTIGAQSITIGKLPKFYYNGGFPDSADLFYANENGVPELVGTMNGKTAVASGTEITGIRESIENAHAEEMSIMRRQNDILMGILEKEFGISKDAIFNSVIDAEEENYRISGTSVFVH